MIKKILAIGLGAAITMGASSAMATAIPAGLTLTSTGTPSAINVFCNGSQALYPIPSNGSLGPLPWVAIAYMFKDFSFQPIPCTFKLASTGQVIGSATLTPTTSTGKITAVSPTSGYSVNITPGTDVAYPGMKVALSAN